MLTGQLVKFFFFLFISSKSLLPSEISNGIGFIEDEDELFFVVSIISESIIVVDEDEEFDDKFDGFIQICRFPETADI